MKKANERKQGWVHLDKIDLKVKTVIRDPEGRYTMMKKSILHKRLRPFYSEILFHCLDASTHLLRDILCTSTFELSYE